MQDYDDIFQRACLIQLGTSVWQGSCKLDPTVMKRVGQRSEWLRGSKDLVNPDLLGPVRKTASQARNEIKKHALPFPIHSIDLISKESLKGIDEKLAHYEAIFWEQYKDFELIYESAKEEARDFLGDLYNDADYPINLLQKFRFEWRFLTLDIPGRSTVLPPDIYEREKEKFQSMMEETRNLAITALREEFGQIVHRIADKLNMESTQPRIIKPSMFTKLKSFLEDFGSRNLFGDEHLVALAEQAESLISGVSTKGIAGNDLMRQSIKNGMNQIRAAIDDAIEDMPKRKIRMAG